MTARRTSRQLRPRLVIRCHSPSDAVSGCRQSKNDVIDGNDQRRLAGRSVPASRSRDRNAVGAPTACDADLIDLVTD